MDRNPTVFLVDDDASIRQAMADLANSMNLAIECYGSGDEFLEAYEGFRPGCVLLEVNIPGGGGLDVQQRLAAAEDPIPLIFLTSREDVPVAVQAMRAGALHFLLKPFSEEDVRRAVEEAIQLDRQRREEALGRRLVSERLAVLTEKEMQVLELIAEGVSIQAITERLKIAKRTVQMRRARLMEKLGVKSVVELVHLEMAVSNGNGHGGPARRTKRSRASDSLAQSSPDGEELTRSL